MMNKRGFTLMELLVYMAIVGIVVVVAGQVYSDSTKMRVRTQSMIKANQEAENVALLLRNDMEQMGAKSSREEIVSNGDDTFSSVFRDVYMDPSNVDESLRDSSSFVLTSEEDLKFRKVRYTDDGKYYSVEEVRWFLDETDLKRSCWTVAKKAGVTLDENDPCSKESEDEAVPVIIAEHVTSFSVEAGRPQVLEDDVQLFPRTGDNFMLVPRFGETHYNFIDVENNGTSSKLSGFASNFDMMNNQVVDISSDPTQAEKNQLFAFEYESAGTPSATQWKTYCQLEGNNFTFVPLVTYEISFEIPASTNTNKMAMFKPEQDFLAVGFRNVEGASSSQIEDFPFYPPALMASSAKIRAMRFSVADTVKNVCMEFTFASASPVTATGDLTIENLKLKQLATTTYKFTSWNTETTANKKEKKNVKAFQFELKIKKNKENGSVRQTVLVPSNGPRD